MTKSSEIHQMLNKEISIKLKDLFLIPCLLKLSINYHNNNKDEESSKTAVSMYINIILDIFKKNGLSELTDPSYYIKIFEQCELACMTRVEQILKEDKNNESTTQDEKDLHKTLQDFLNGLND